MRQLGEFTKRALALDDSDSVAHWMRALVKLHRREYAEAAFHYERSLELNPYDLDGRWNYVAFLCCIGEGERAVEEIAIGRRLNPFGLSWGPWIEGIVYFSARRYEDAIAALGRSTIEVNEVRLWQAASLAEAGRIEEARGRLKEYLRVARTDMANYPGDRLGDWEGWIGATMPYRDRRDLDHLLGALAKAGMAE